MIPYFLTFCLKSFLELEKGEKIGGISNFVNLIFKFKSPMFPEAVDCTDNPAMKT